MENRFINENNKHIFAAEKKYLEETLSYITERKKYLDTNNARREQDSIDLKRAAYEEGLEMKETDGNSHFDSSMVQNELREQFEIINYQLEESISLGRLYKRPYFGHISFLFPEDKEATEVYIGLRDVIDADNYKQYIIDWRAPIANLYYDYHELGEAQYTHNDIEFTGELLAKYQLMIENSELINVLDTTEQINDEILQLVLSQKGSASMKNIVDTIQAEQNEIIRAEKNRTLLVQGVAGSGKTSIALHRAAFLLYLDKTMLAEDMLLISPSASFASYIANVLPSLGERNISYITMEGLLRDELGDAFERYAHYQFEPADQDKLQAFSDFEIITHVDDFVEFFSKAVFSPKTIKLGDDFTISAKQVNGFYHRNYSMLPAFAREKEINRHISELINNKTLYAEYQETIATALSEMYAISTMHEIYQVFRSWLVEDKGFSEEHLTNEVFDYVDLVLLTLLKIHLFGQSDNDWIKHVVVDEMQDLLPLEHEVVRLVCSCPRTILGDEHQAVKYKLPEDFLTELEGLYKRDKLRVETYRLNKSYRSTSEITNFSKKLIEVESIQAIDRNGPEVEVHEYAHGEESMAEIAQDIYQVLLSWRDKGYSNAAVIAKDTDESLSFDEKLQAIMLEDASTDNLLLNKYLREEDEFAVTITDIAGSKGIEFDGVIILNASAEKYNTELDRTKLYVASTRPLHELQLFSDGPVSEFIS